MRAPSFCSVHTTIPLPTLSLNHHYTTSLLTSYRLKVVRRIPAISIRFTEEVSDDMEQKTAVEKDAKVIVKGEEDRPDCKADVHSSKRPGVVKRSEEDTSGGGGGRRRRKKRGPTQ